MRLREEIPEALAGERIDRVVAMLTGCSRAEVAALVAAGEVRVSGVAATSRSAKVRLGDVVELEVPDPAAARELVPEPGVTFVVVHEDEHLIVIDKPAGLVVHPGAGQHTGTLVHGLLARYPELAGVGIDPVRPGIVHRLDKGTSGLLLVARTQAAYTALVRALAARDVHRRYRTLAWGLVASPTGLIDAPIGRSLREPTRMAVVERGKEARTRYEVLATYHEPVELTQLACTLETGRTHQIRVHLRSIGHPVVGDVRYDGARQSLPLERPFLHAEVLELAHPVTGEALRFASELPADLQALLDRLR
ncbi:MAG TPA: RluA family pseudouridine synthase [Acidimicrobiales bacterium]|nr:RluA family pseudouridine synthase [Acidimicrobiales bacterium]